MMKGMVDSAQSSPSSQLLGKLRHSFSVGTQGNSVAGLSNQIVPSQGDSQDEPEATMAKSTDQQQISPVQANTQPNSGEENSQTPDLDLLDKVISEAETGEKADDNPATQAEPILPVAETSNHQSVTQQVPSSDQDLGMMAQSSTNALDNALQAQEAMMAQSQPKTGSKESLSSSGVDQPGIEATTGIQYIEQEPNPEIPPEVEEYLEFVEDHANAAPQQIVIADKTGVDLAKSYPKQSVVVLPITEEEERAGAKKSSKFSIRWLVEWSRKIMKKFRGEVIYRQME